MRTNNQINNDYANLHDSAVENINTYAANNTAALKAVTTAKTVDEINAAVSAVINSVATFFKTSNPDIVYPEFLYRYNYEPSNFTYINLTVRSKLKADVKYVRTTKVNIDDNFVNSVGKVFLDSILEIFSIEQAHNNIQELNAILANICKENNIPYTFGFTVQGSGSSIVESITDDEVIFNASISSAHTLSELAICQAGDEYSDFVRDSVIKTMVDTLLTVPTTTQLVKSKLDIIKTVTGVTTKKHASKIIRGAYHKNARYIAKQKSGVAYYNETVSINGEDVNVFALVEKTEDGNLRVILSPFNTATLDNVNFDVINALKEFA